MKKILISVCLALLSAGVFAQPSTGVNLGGGFIHNFYSADNGSAIDNKCYFGPYVELGYDLSFGKHTGLYVAARYEFMHLYLGASGYNYLYNVPVRSQIYTYRHYLDIPIKFLFCTNFSYTNKFFFDLGPTVNFWLGNNSHTYSASPFGGTAEVIHWFQAVPNLYNRVNVSVGANVGVILDQTKLFIGYDYGGLISFIKPEYGKGQIHQLRIGAQYVF